MRQLLRRLRYYIPWRLKTCGCGDVRPVGEFCAACGKCEMGCCMCEFTDIEELEPRRPSPLWTALATWGALAVIAALAATGAVVLDLVP